MGDTHLMVIYTDQRLVGNKSFSIDGIRGSEHSVFELTKDEIVQVVALEVYPK